MSAYNERGLLLFQQGKFDKAEAEYRLALQEQPDDPEALAWLALSLSNQEKYAKALDCAREALSAAP